MDASRKPELDSEAPIGHNRCKRRDEAPLRDSRAGFERIEAFPRRSCDGPLKTPRRKHHRGRRPAPRYLSQKVSQNLPSMMALTTAENDQLLMEARLHAVLTCSLEGVMVAPLAKFRQHYNMEVEQ